MMFQHSPKRSTQKIIKLSAGDVEDAKRLLKLISQDDDLTGDGSEERSGPKQAPALLRKAREILANRRRRYETFGTGMFGEPAWDILLLVYVLRAGQRPTIGRLGDLSGATKSTAQRWIDYLEAQGWIIRQPHPTDKRTGFVELSECGREAVEAYLSETASD